MCLQIRNNCQCNVLSLCYFIQISKFHFLPHVTQDVSQKVRVSNSKEEAEQSVTAQVEVNTFPTQDLICQSLLSWCAIHFQSLTSLFLASYWLHLISWAYIYMHVCMYICVCIPQCSSFNNIIFCKQWFPIYHRKCCDPPFLGTLHEDTRLAPYFIPFQVNYIVFLLRKFMQYRPFRAATI